MNTLNTAETSAETVKAQDEGIGADDVMIDKLQRAVSKLEVSDFINEWTPDSAEPALEIVHLLAHAYCEGDKGLISVHRFNDQAQSFYIDLNFINIDGVDFNIQNLGSALALLNKLGVIKLGECSLTSNGLYSLDDEQPIGLTLGLYDIGQEVRFLPEAVISLARSKEIARVQSLPKSQLYYEVEQIECAMEEINSGLTLLSAEMGNETDIEFGLAHMEELETLLAGIRVQIDDADEQCPLEFFNDLLERMGGREHMDSNPASDEEQVVDAMRLQGLQEAKAAYENCIAGGRIHAPATS